MRMTKEHYAHDCKICLKPFTIFRWCPGRGMRFRRTEICQTCSRLKNACQSCILDLQYGLPIQIRDGVLQIKEKCPQNDANREYFLATNAAKLARTDASLIDYEQTDPAARALLEKLGKEYKDRKSVQQRNQPHPCSFYAKGTCNRGDACPFRHELSTERFPNLKSYRDRFYGMEDPAAADLVERHPELKNVMEAEATSLASDPSKDPTLRSLFVMGLREGLDAAILQQHFGAMSVKTVADGAAAIVSFKTRLEAEIAADANLGNQTEINGVSVRVTWAKSQSKPLARSTARLKSSTLDKRQPMTDGAVPSDSDFLINHLESIAKSVEKQ